MSNVIRPGLVPRVLASLVVLVSLVAVVGVVPSCAGRYSKGGVGGVTYRMSLDRPSVPGGVGWAVNIKMRSEFEGDLKVDGISFGTVIRGDHVEVTDEAVVLVNGEERPPAG